jgi:hypothetical protein
MLSTTQTCLHNVLIANPAAVRARPARGVRHVRYAERPRQDDNIADAAATAVEDKLEGFVEATKENSGLFKDTISQQPGNRSAAKGSPIDESGKAGEAMSPGGLT